MRIFEDISTKEKFYVDVNVLDDEGYLLCINCETNEYKNKRFYELNILSPEFLRVVKLEDNTHAYIVGEPLYESAIKFKFDITFYGFNDKLEPILFDYNQIKEYIL